jgi:hypothetical protein
MEQVMARLEKGKPCKKKGMTYRGLEQWTVAGTERMQEITAQVRKAVLDEQSQQRERKAFDPEVLASRSASLSVASQQRAIELAKADEEEVQQERQKLLLLLKKKDNSTDTSSASASSSQRKVSRQGRRSWWSLTQSRERRVKS